MAKLTREDKMNIYIKHKEGESYTSLSKLYNIRGDNICYLISLIDYHGFDVLRKNKNRKYSKELKQTILDSVLTEGKSVRETAIKYGLSSDGMLSNWIRSYKANNYVIVEKKKGRQPTMTKQKNEAKKYEEMTAEEKVKFLENKNLYLEAENEYLKKLRAVVQQRKDQQPKKK